jgi:hypothetical protein
MSKGLRRQGPAVVVAMVALVVALGGTVYAAGKINGHAVKVKSLPGNRLAMGSVPGNRLKPGAVGKAQLAPDSITRVQIDMSALGQVPSATHAETAGSAQESVKALEAGKAEEAKLVNGHRAECEPGTRYFAGSCWQIFPSATALTAPGAAAACAQQDGELPEALALKAFAEEEGVELAVGDEWTSDIPVVTGTNVYAVVTVNSKGEVGSAASGSAKKFRCVIPLVH